MNTKTDYRNAVIQQGLLPLFYHADATVCLRVIEALYDGGIRLVEYTNRGETALKNFEFLKQEVALQYPDLKLGIGTIKTTEAAKAFTDAGADFFVSPGISLSLAEFFVSGNCLWIPGCVTTSELMMAEEHEIDLVKLFPGSLLQPSYVRSVREIFPAMHFMPTGGVDVSEDNLDAWFSAGVSAVGMGSKLITMEMLENKQYEAITTITATTLDCITSIKNKHAANSNR